MVKQEAGAELLALEQKNYKPLVPLESNKLFVFLSLSTQHWNSSALVKFSRTVHLPMKSAWTPLRTNWRKLASWLKKPTRNTMRWLPGSRLLDSACFSGCWCVACVILMNALNENITRKQEFLRNLTIFINNTKVVQITCLIWSHLMAPFNTLHEWF